MKKQKYNLEINSLIKLIDEVLNEIGTSSLFNNSKFVLHELSSNYWLGFNLIGDDNKKLPITLSIFEKGISIWFEYEINEIFFSFSKLKENKNYSYLNYLLKTILTGFLLIEHSGQKRTRVKLFDKLGNIKFEYKFHSGFLTFGFCKSTDSKLYFPIF